MGMVQDVEKLKKQMATLMALLKNPDKNASSVLYLVKTIESIESINFDLSYKWNCAAAYIQNKGLDKEYNEWIAKVEQIPNPDMRKLFMMQPIGEPPKGTPTAPELCGIENPFRKGMSCMDIHNHEGEEHIGMDNEGKMFHWTKDKDMGEVESSELPQAPASEKHHCQNCDTEINEPGLCNDCAGLGPEDEPASLEEHDEGEDAEEPEEEKDEEQPEQ